MSTVDTLVVGPVATVTLNRPEVRNAFDAYMIAELTEVFTSLAASSTVRVIVLRGAGRVFSGGADVNWMRDSLDFTEDQNVEDASNMSRMFAAIDSVDKPVVGKVHGAALGGGMGLLSVCDIVVASSETTFGFTETRLGIIPAVISAFVLPKIGESWARALYLTGEKFDAFTAQRIGLVHWVVSQDDLDASVQKKADELLNSGPYAVAAAKQLIRDVRDIASDDMRAMTARRISDIRVSDEAQKGLRAFLDKQPPPWRVADD